MTTRFTVWDWLSCGWELHTPARGEDRFEPIHLLIACPYPLFSASFHLQHFPRHPCLFLSASIRICLTFCSTRSQGMPCTSSFQKGLHYIILLRVTTAHDPPSWSCHNYTASFTFASPLSLSISSRTAMHTTCLDTGHLTMEPSWRLCRADIFRSPFYRTLWRHWRTTASFITCSKCLGALD